MTKELIKPSWYSEEFYNKTRTHEEWLYELWKRYHFIQVQIGFSSSSHTHPIKEQRKDFIASIFEKKIEKFLDHLVKAKPPQPIRYPSVSDIFIMYHLFTNSNWYKKNPNREAFESAIPKIINEEILSQEQESAFYEMYETPWCVFYENHQQDNWCPKKEMEYLSGVFLSLEPGYEKKDIITILKKKLNASIGKLQGIQYQFDSWQERKILAVFDLRLWFKIQRIECTNIAIHRLIWPKGRVSNNTGDLVNPDDDIAHSIDLTNRVIDKSVICSLLSACEARKFKKETFRAL